MMLLTSRRRLLLSVLMLASLALALSTATPSTTRAAAHPDPETQAPDPSPAEVRVVVRTVGSPLALAARVEALGGKVLYAFEHAEALSVSVPADRLAALRAATGVESAEPQRRLRPAIAPLGLPRLPGFGRPQLSGPPERAVIEPMPVSASAKLRAVPFDPRELRSTGERGGAAAGDAGPGTAPATFLGYDILTGAAEVWDEAGTGEGALVAIIDTGIYPSHPLLVGSVVGGMSLVPAEEEEAIDLDEDGSPDGRSFGWNALQNHPHGTFVSGLVAGHADLILPADNPLALSLGHYSPESVEPAEEGTVRIRLAGTAPGASLYGVKVFPYDGGGAPDARVAEAIDRLLTMKETGILDVDVINMSLSGPVLCDGCNILDEIVDAASAMGIVVVSAASNDGPSLMTVGTPGAALSGLAAGATMDPLHTRVAIEVFFGAPPGTGALAFPSDALMVADFSSRGPTGDGRVKPDIMATGFLNYSSTVVDADEDGLPDTPFFGFGSGTSFATPTVAGAAALLVAYGEELGRFGEAPYINNVLTRAALAVEDLDALSQLHRGSGFVHLPKAVALLEQGRVWHPAPTDDHNAAQERVSLFHPTARGDSPAIAPGHSYDFLIRVRPSATRLIIRFPEVQLSGMQNPILGDALVAAIHSAKRGGNGDYVFFEALEPGAEYVYEHPERGTMRLTLTGAASNWGPAAAGFEILVEEEPLAADYWFEGAVEHEGVAEHAIELPAGVAALGAVLAWKHDWSEFPTYDLDLALEHAERTVTTTGSVDSPEAILVESPSSGAWKLRVTELGTVTTGRERYRLGVKLFDELPAAGDVYRIAEAEGAFTGVVTSGAAAPSAPMLRGIQPNPFHPSTEIRFEVSTETDVGVRIYDVGGRLVRTLIDARLDAGVHSVRWEGRDASGGAVASGVYFLQLKTANGAVTRKLTLIESP